MASWDIWCEGYTANEGTFPAVLLTRDTPVEADTFDEAVEKLAATHPDGHFISKNANGWNFWGCRIFTNQHEASQSFG